MFPSSTYRLQFNKDFTFQHCLDMLPYWRRLGISAIYAAPIFEAVPGSMHGYDVVNPQCINPEIGTEAELKALTDQLKAYGIQWIQDIVPNHMAYHYNNNWLMDVLEKGSQSSYVTFFDISTSSPVHNGRLMVPFLGNSPEEGFQNKWIKIEYDAESQRLVFTHDHHRWPLNPRSYASLLETGMAEENEAATQFINHIHDLKKLDDAIQFEAGWNEAKMQFAALLNHETTADMVLACIEKANNDPVILHQIHNEQSYVLCNSAETHTAINFRRFFAVNALICTNVHLPEVFEAHHTYLKKLFDKNIIQGVRVDHVDGLYDAAAYVNNLRALLGSKAYIVVEKILEPGECLPENWPVQGTSGYDYLAMVNNVLTMPGSSDAFSNFYHELTGTASDVHKAIREKKADFLHAYMGGELENLVQLFSTSGVVTTEQLADTSRQDLKQAIAAILIECPVYRYYGNSFPLPDTDKKAIADIFDTIRKTAVIPASAIDLLQNTLLNDDRPVTPLHREKIRHFYMRLMQFSGPLMAKGVEDTVMFTYNRFIGHNEVGDSPESFGATPATYHNQMQHRMQHWPHAMNGTSTHDTKRGEDARARLNVLPAMPEKWFATVQEWRSLNKELNQYDMPDSNDEYLIYQTLAGTYPMPGDAKEEAAYPDRLKQFLYKALREANTHTGWQHPNDQYETATVNFAMSLLDKGRPFWQHFTIFHREVAGAGIVNSLVQTVLKFTSPGIPDVYQGCEQWDFSLVDPDNRRPVDFELRKQLLETPTNDTAALQTMWDERFGGGIKVWLTACLFALRAKQPDFFATAAYIPLEVIGHAKDHVLAFARHNADKWLIIVVPLHLPALPQNNWGDTRLVLPDGVPELACLLTGQPTEICNLYMKEVFSIIPSGLFGAGL